MASRPPPGSPRPRIPEDPEGYDPVEPEWPGTCLGCARRGKHCFSLGFRCLKHQRPDGEYVVFAERRLYGNEEES